jgi:hypothetical protein
MNVHSPFIDTDVVAAGAVIPTKGFISTILAAHHSVQVSSGDALGGYIFNPIDAFDQDLSVPTVLFVDPTGPAASEITGTTVGLQPGQYFIIPPQSEYGVWVNSNAVGHKFVVVQILPQEPPQPPFIKGDFPPSGPTGLERTIPAYLYQEYSDDDDLQAFIRAYNEMQQDIVDTFNALNLPIYTKDPVSGALLDWVGQGVYGYPRPSLLYKLPTIIGPYNTGQYNTQQYNFWQYYFPTAPALVNDDIYRRCITWHYHKGDGKRFSVEWLKKRIMRFLLGINGTSPNIDNTYQISVTFGAHCDVTIRLILVDRSISDGALYNDNLFQYNVMRYNQVDTVAINLPPLPNITQFADAVRSGILELPFQFIWDDVVTG